MPFLVGDNVARLLRVMRHQAAIDPRFAEDIKSLAESVPYVIIHPYEGTPPIRCECCGTMVAQCPEAEVSVKPWAFKPAIWETETGRKHTLRRCDWLREGGRA